MSPQTKSALLTLCAVANEHRRPGGLFSDPEAAAMWEALTRTITIELPSLHSIYITGIILRTIIFDYAVMAFCSAHDNPKVIDLGCGFSTRAYRLGLDRVRRWTHIDLPEVIDLRRALRPLRYNEAALVWDLTAPGLLEWEFGGAATLLIAEGVLSFLDWQAMAGMLARLKIQFPGATLLGTALLAPKFVPSDVFWDELGIRPQWSAPSLQGLVESWPLRIEQHWIMDRVLDRFSGRELERVQADASGLLFRAIL